MRIALLAFALLAVATAASAQTPAKTIGTPQRPQIAPSMIVLNAKAAKLAGRTLTLEGVSPSAIVFADRPIRAAGHALTAHLLEEWSASAPDSFACARARTSSAAASVARQDGMRSGSSDDAACGTAFMARVPA